MKRAQSSRSALQLSCAMSATRLRSRITEAVVPDSLVIVIRLAIGCFGAVKARIKGQCGGRFALPGGGIQFAANCNSACDLRVNVRVSLHQSFELNCGNAPSRL